jgi:hypothetical protein
MHAFLIATKNLVQSCSASTRIREGKSELSRVAGLFLLLSIAFATAPSVVANDPMNPTYSPKIDPFYSTRAEVDHDEGLYEFSIIGVLVDCANPSGRTIKLAGGPFTTTTTTDEQGYFTVTVLLPLVDGIGQTVSGVLQENGQNESEVAFLTIE